MHNTSHIKHNFKIGIYILITALLALAGCSGVAVKTAENDCAKVVGDEKKLNCYLQDLRYSINSQIQSDLDTWFKFNYVDEGRPYLTDASVAIKLKNNGEVRELAIVQSSGDSSFDNALLQAIKNASPFVLPKEEKIRSRLLEFTWAVHF